MFDKNYSFQGTHAKYVNKLTAKFDDKNQLFNRNIDVYIMAPVVGFLYQRKADINLGETTTIFTEQLIKEKDNLLFNYRLIMLLDKDNVPDIEERIHKAFRSFGSEEAKSDEALYEKYVMGGVEVLYEKLIEQSHGADDYLKYLYDFLEEIDERYNQDVGVDVINDLCLIAKG